MKTTKKHKNYPLLFSVVTGDIIAIVGAYLVGNAFVFIILSLLELPIIYLFDFIRAKRFKKSIKELKAFWIVTIICAAVMSLMVLIIGWADGYKYDIGKIFGSLAIVLCEYYLLIIISLLLFIIAESIYYFIHRDQASSYKWTNKRERLYHGYFTLFHLMVIIVGLVIIGNWNEPWVFLALVSTKIFVEIVAFKNINDGDQVASKKKIKKSIWHKNI